MKVAVVMTGGGAGGLQQVALPYALALKEQGHDVLLVLSRRSPLVGEAIELGLAPALIFSPRKPWPLSLFHVAALRHHLSAFGTEAVIGIAAKGYHEARRAVGTKMPVLSHCGDTRPKVVAKLLGADHLIVSSDEMADIARECGAKPGHQSVVPNFLIGAPVSHDYDRAAPVHIGSFGRFAERKGFDLLIEAASLLKAAHVDFRLTIGGSGEEEKRLKALAETRGVPVAFPGWISNAAKSEFLKSLDIFVCPSRLEPFGNVYVDALQHGLPVVTAETTGARFIFAKGQGAVVVRPDDAEALAQGIRLLIADAGLRRTLGEAGCQAFLTRFSVESAGRLLSQALEKAVADWRGQARTGSN